MGLFHACLHRQPVCPLWSQATWLQTTFHRTTMDYSMWTTIFMHGMASPIKLTQPTLSLAWLKFQDEVQNMNLHGTCNRIIIYNRHRSTYFTSWLTEWRTGGLLDPCCSGLSWLRCWSTSDCKEFLDTSWSLPLKQVVLPHHLRTWLSRRANVHWSRENSRNTTWTHRFQLLRCFIVPLTQDGPSESRRLLRC